MDLASSKHLEHLLSRIEQMKSENLALKAELKKMMPTEEKSSHKTNKKNKNENIPSLF